MEEFSKQYIELTDFDLPIDFDIEELAKGLDSGLYIPMICEGWGFEAIGKDKEGNLMLHFDDRGWVDYEVAVEELREKIEELRNR